MKYLSFNVAPINIAVIIFHNLQSKYVFDGSVFRVQMYPTCTMHKLNKDLIRVGLRSGHLSTRRSAPAALCRRGNLSARATRLMNYC